METLLVVAKIIGSPSKNETFKIVLSVIMTIDNAQISMWHNNVLCL